MSLLLPKHQYYSFSVGTRARCVARSYLKSWQRLSASLPPSSLFQDLFSVIDVLALFLLAHLREAAWQYTLPGATDGLQPDFLILSLFQSLDS